mgnify:CR=1 FL=1
MYNLASKILSLFLDPLALAILLLVCAFLIQKLRPKIFMCEALRAKDDAKHVAIDPFQQVQWKGIGLHNLKLSGLVRLVEFHQKPSFIVLAEFVEEKRIIDLALVDGWTTFDFKLVDTFLCDKILRIGGILVMRTGGTPSGIKLVAYVKTNWPWYEHIGTSNHNNWEDLVAFRKISPDIRRWKFHEEF